MKMKTSVNRAIIAVTHSKWIQPTLMALALCVAVLSMTGCGTPHH